MQEGTKKTIIWETNSEPPKNYIWIKPDGIPYEYDKELREWGVSKNIGAAGGISVVCKTTAEWNETIGYIPAVGEIIVYTDYKQVEKDGEMVNVPGIKIGSGNAYVQDLMFVSGSTIDIDFYDHINNTSIHTNSKEKDFWNTKVSIDESKLRSETLFFKTN